MPTTIPSVKPSAPNPSATLAVSAAARVIADRVDAWRLVGGRPLVLALDGHGASGKSTIARHLALAVGAALVATDDFFQAGSGQEGLGSDEPLGRYYDWTRLRSEALQPLRQGQRASFRSSNPFVPDRDGEWISVEPSPVIVLEGVGAASDALDGLVDRRVLVRTSDPERLARLRARVSPEDWDEEWLAEERRYLASRPDAVFDLIVSGECESAGAQAES